MVETLPTIGVLALQGDFAEHIEALRNCGTHATPVRYCCEIERIDGLIIPGGESTAVAKLSSDGNDTICNAILARASRGMPVYGTCMGAILLAKDIKGSTQGRLGLMDITIQRNAFGSQRDSCERVLDIPAVGPEPFRGIFIRAPLIAACGSDVEVQCRIEDGIAMVRQGNLLATIFHPELTDDRRIHQYFLSMVNSTRP